MSSVEDTAELRADLAHVLHNSDSYHSKLDNALCRNYGLRSLLYMRRDKASRSIEDICDRLAQQVAILKNEMLERVSEFTVQKEQQLLLEREKLVGLKSELSQKFDKIKDLLQVCHEDELHASGRNTLGEVESISSSAYDEGTSDVLFLEYRCSDIMDRFQDSDILGYIQCTGLDPEEVTVSSDFSKAFLGIEETFFIQVSSKHHKEALTYVSVCVEDPNKTNIAVEVKDKQDGTFSVCYTPESMGVYTLYVKVYGANIPGSPFNIMVVDKSEESSQTSQEEKVSKTCPKVARSALSAVNKILTSKPVVKKNSSTEKVLTKQWPVRCHSEDYSRFSKTDVDIGGEKRRNFVLRKVNSQRSISERSSKDSDIYNWSSKTTTEISDKQISKPVVVEPSMARRGGDNDIKPKSRWASGKITISSCGIKKRSWSDSEKELSSTCSEDDRQIKPYDHSIDLKITVKNEAFIDRNNNVEKSGTMQGVGGGDSVHSKGRGRRLHSASLRNSEPTSPDENKDQASTLQKGKSSTLRTSELATDHNVAVSFCKKQVEKVSFPASKGTSFNVKTAEQASPLKNNAENLMGSKDTLKTTEPVPKVVRPKLNRSGPSWLSQKTDSENVMTSKDTLKTTELVQKVARPKLDRSGPSWLSKKTDAENVMTSKESLKTTELVPKVVRPKLDRSGPKVAPPKSSNSTSPVSCSATSDMESKQLKSEPSQTSKIVKCKEEEINDKEENKSQEPEDLVQNKICFKRTGKYWIDGHLTLDMGTTPEVTFVHKIGRRGAGMSGVLQYPIGVCTSNDCVIIGDNGNDCIKLFSLDGKHTGTIGYNHYFKRPSAVLYTSDTIFVKDNVKIQAFDIDGERLREFGEKVLRKPYGLVLTENGKLMTLDHSRAALVFFTKRGVYIEDKPFQPLLGRPQDAKCRFMAAFKDTVVVTDLGRREVYFTTMDGKTVKTLSDKCQGPGQFVEPSGVTIDSKGNVFIADSRAMKIQVFNLKGDFLCKLPLPEAITRPSDIHITPDGFLYICNLLDHSISVFKVE